MSMKATAPTNPMLYFTAGRNCWNLFQPACLGKKKPSYTLWQLPSQNSVPGCHDNKRWHTTLKFPYDEWLLKLVCAYVLLFGLAISWIEDNNIAYWHKLKVLFCLSISWHRTGWQPLCYDITRLTITILDVLYFTVLNPLLLYSQLSFLTPVCFG